MKHVCVCIFRWLDLPQNKWPYEQTNRKLYLNTQAWFSINVARPDENRRRIWGVFRINQKPGPLCSFKNCQHLSSVCHDPPLKMLSQCNNNHQKNERNAPDFGVCICAFHLIEKHVSACTPLEAWPCCQPTTSDQMDICIVYLYLCTCICVFVFVCLCVFICVFVYLHFSRGLALLPAYNKWPDGHFYLCICICVFAFVFVCLCVCICVFALRQRLGLAARLQRVTRWTFFGVGHTEHWWCSSAEQLKQLDLNLKKKCLI